MKKKAKQEPWYPTLEAFERIIITRRLREMKGHREMTAKSLGVSVRCLYYKIAQYGLREHVRE
jgi:DNA-binding NtrC family response regulator